VPSRGDGSRSCLAMFRLRGAADYQLRTGITESLYRGRVVPRWTG
jgi:hypothetical protein